MLIGMDTQKMFDYWLVIASYYMHLSKDFPRVEKYAHI